MWFLNNYPQIIKIEEHEAINFNGDTVYHICGYLKDGNLFETRSEGGTKQESRIFFERRLKEREVIKQDAIAQKLWKELDFVGYSARCDELKKIVQDNHDSP